LHRDRRVEFTFQGYSHNLHVQHFYVKFAFIQQIYATNKPEAKWRKITKPESDLNKYIDMEPRPLIEVVGVETHTWSERQIIEFTFFSVYQSLIGLLLLCRATITNQVLVDREGSKYYYLSFTPCVSLLPPLQSAVQVSMAAFGERAVSAIASFYLCRSLDVKQEQIGCVQQKKSSLVSALH